MERTKEQERGMLKKPRSPWKKNFWKELGYNLGRLDLLMTALTTRAALLHPQLGS